MRDVCYAVHKLGVPACGDCLREDCGASLLAARHRKPSRDSSYLRLNFESRAIGPLNSVMHAVR